ncbi:MAG: glycosyltransferase family 4 protein [Thermoplasmatales archaeon]|nr:glycosyltransferase family 4 protein [Thermoplasmatales archaeon]
MNDNKKNKVLLILPWPSQSFMDNDEKILKKHFNVVTLTKAGDKSFYLKILKILLKNEVDLLYLWFAHYRFAPIIFLSKLFKKPSIVIAGGFDVAYVPDIEYGQFNYSWFKKIRAKFVLKYANKVLVVDPSLKEDAIKNAKISGENIDYLPTGYDPNYWKPKGEKENIVLTVGAVNNTIVERKGFKTFVKAARYFPDVKFVLVGKHVDDSINQLKSIAPSNVEFTGFVSDEELLEFYQKAKIFCQLSRYEGLPNALCEGMLCECIPIGTKYCGIPSAIGDTGFYVSFGNVLETANAIKKALNKPDELGKKARVRIVQKFPKDRREKGLVATIRSLVKK